MFKKANGRKLVMREAGNEQNWQGKWWLAQEKVKT